MTKTVVSFLVAILALLAVACAGGDTVEPTSQPAARAAQPSPSPVPATATAIAAAEPEPTRTPAPTAAPAPTATTAPIATIAPRAPTATAIPEGYDSNTALYRIFPAFSIVRPDLEDTLDEVVERNDRSLVPFLVEILRFMPSRKSADLIGQTLRDLTGQNYESDDWNSWMEWLGQNLDSFELPSAYIAWKARTYSAIDPRFDLFIRQADEISRIDPSEVVWGGVIPDGIPDLLNPKSFTPDEATYMEPDDRVFGVRINGESKAYPLRVVNAHEMVNDRVGGEPISLMW